MISIKQALTIRSGDTVYDYYGRVLLIHSYFIEYDKGIPTTIEFGCKDINTNEQLRYSYDEIYINYNDLSDEEKLFLIWLRKNTDFYVSYDMELLKQAFITGFADGYNYKRKNLAEEQLQK